MKKILLALITLFATHGNAQTLLYKISGNGLKAPSYIYGTIHITCDASLDVNTKKALDETQQLYLELDMDDPSMMTSMMGGMSMQNGEKMSNLASAEDFALVDEYLTKNMGASAKMLDNLKPFMVSTMLLPGLMPCTLTSVEDELMKISKAQNEEIYGLETVEEQLAVFDKIPYQIQMDELVASVKNKFADDKLELDKMFELYEKKDLDAMLDMMDTSKNDIVAKYQDDLLNNRNANWIPKITKIAKEKPTFFGVGAGHLGGDHGVLALLRKSGFTVTPVL